jgi:Ca2+-binding EF-hand superfamily protein
LLYDLSQEAYDQIVSIFMTFDEDDSGRLDRKELAKLAKWLNYAQQPGDIDRIFAEMDSQRTGSLTLDDFCTWLKYHRPNPERLYGLSQTEYNTVMMQFHVYDTNGDGELNEDEFVRLCTSLRYYPNETEARVVFRRIDIDRNGTVDLNEFLVFRAQKGR